MTEHDAHAGHHHHAPVDHPHIGTGSSPAETVKDPVCGMEVNPATAGLRSEYGGKTYFFCSAKCHDTFEAAPT
ncbi:YHS domain-containing protein, partial [Xanthobacter flavus]